MFTGLWPAEADYEIVDLKIDGRRIRVVRPCDLRKPRYIEPDSVPGIALSFSEIGEDEEKLLGFVRRFGLLGYARLFPRETKYGGDPVAWCLRHAQQVAVAFLTIGHIKRGAAQVRDELPGLLRSIGWDLAGSAAEGKPERLFAPTRKTILVKDDNGIVNPQKLHIIRPGALLEADWPADPLRVAWRFLSHLINGQICGLRLEVSEEKLAPVFSFDALLQVIYLELADELRGLHTRMCEQCKKFFPATRLDARHCSDKCRMQASRDRKKERERRRKHHGRIQKKGK